MRVLSLFDGISSGRVALERAGIPVEKYYASEIDKYAIQIAQKNYPDTIQLGDVTQIDFTQFAGRIDLVIGGSPCQGFSFAGKQLNFDDPRSKLFFEFVRAVKTIKPKYFLLENVKMKQEYQDVISEQLGVQPIEINSALVSAQNRKRLYWTNIPNISQPADKGILLKDIVHEYEILGVGMDIEKEKHIKQYIVPFDKTLQILEKEVEKGKVGFFRKDSQANRVYFIHDKAVCLCGDAGGGAAKMGQYLFGCITPDRVEKRQNGQRFNDGKKFYTLTAQDKHGVLIEGYIRKLTPIECERLQTLPDNFSEKGLIQWNYANVMGVFSQSQAGKLNSVINTILDGYETELRSLAESWLISRKSASKMDAATANKHLWASVLNIIKSGNDNSQQTIPRNVRFVMNRLDRGVVECALNTITSGEHTATLYTVILENMSRMATKEDGIINSQTVDGCIRQLLNKCLAENSAQTKLFIISTLINLITVKAIFSYAKATGSIFVSIDNLNTLQGNSLETELSGLRMVNITEISDSARYKALGNGWTVDVIAHILKGIKG